MAEKMPCDIIQDLMPLVIDDVACENSRKAVETHIADCASCAEIYHAMRQPAPVLPIDQQEEQHFQQAMKKIRRRGQAGKTITVCLILILILTILYNMFHPEMQPIYPITVPIDWMQDAHLERTTDGQVMLRFTPSEQYKTFSGERSITSANEKNTKASADFLIEYFYQSGSTSKSLICLSNGDWVVPIYDSLKVWYYNETANELIFKNMRRLNDEEKHELAIKESKHELDELNAKNVNTDAFYANTVTVYEKAKSFSLIDNNNKMILYTEGDVIPLCDAKTEELFIANKYQMYSFDLSQIQVFLSDGTGISLYH